jgi:RIO kinase 2
MAEGTSEGDNFRLDVVVEASGFGRKDMRVLDEVSTTASDLDARLMLLSTWRQSEMRK